VEVAKYFIARLAFRAGIGALLAIGMTPPKTLTAVFASGRFRVYRGSFRPGLVITWPQFSASSDTRIGWFVHIDSRYGVALEQNASIGSFSRVTTSRKVRTEAGMVRVGRSISIGPNYPPGRLARIDSISEIARD
jgi:hypothetical protein